MQQNGGLGVICAENVFRISTRHLFTGSLRSMAAQFPAKHFEIHKEGDIF
jgi:hypothetical protein